MRHIDDEYVRPAGDADDKKTVRPNAASNADGEGGGEKVIGRRNSVSQEVPSPPDQARLRSGMTPGPGSIPARKVMGRQESDTTIGKGDEIALEIHEKKDEKGAEEAVAAVAAAAAAAAVPMYDEDGDIVPPASRERNIVLFKAPEV
jgi:hypothetical protein